LLDISTATTSVGSVLSEVRKLIRRAVVPTFSKFSARENCGSVPSTDGERTAAPPSMRMYPASGPAPWASISSQGRLKAVVPLSLAKEALSKV
jgi:hypothetical protein